MSQFIRCSLVAVNFLLWLGTSVAFATNHTVNKKALATIIGFQKVIWSAARLETQFLNRDEQSHLTDFWRQIYRSDKNLICTHGLNDVWDSTWESLNKIPIDLKLLKEPESIFLEAEKAVEDYYEYHPEKLQELPDIGQIYQENLVVTCSAGIEAINDSIIKFVTKGIQTLLSVIPPSQTNR